MTWQRRPQTLTKESLAGREPSLWRYEEVLPVQYDWAMLKLGEGWTPLHHARRLGEAIGCYQHVHQG